MAPSPRASKQTSCLFRAVHSLSVGVYHGILIGRSVLVQHVEVFTRQPLAGRAGQRLSIRFAFFLPPRSHRGRCLCRFKTFGAAMSAVMISVAMVSSPPTCLPSALFGEWAFHLTSCQSKGSLVTQIIRLDRPSRALLWEKHAVTGGMAESQDSAGTFTVLGSVDAVDIEANGISYYAWGCGNGSALAGTWHDRNAEQKGCFTATSDVAMKDCESGECHGALASRSSTGSGGGGETVARRLQLGLRKRVLSSRRPNPVGTQALIPEAETPRDSDSPRSSLGASDALAAAAINANPLLFTWRAATSATVASVRGLLGQKELSSVAVAATSAAVPPALPSLPPSPPIQAPLPTALDWRTHRGGGWLSPPVDMLEETMSTPCLGATHILAGVAAAEARIRIVTNGRQSERLSAAEVLACTPYMRDPESCSEVHSAFLVGKYGREHGFARDSCVPWTTATLAAASSAGNRSSNASAFSRPQCGRLPPCAGSKLRRRVRTTRFVGGYYGNTSTAGLLEELQQGPVALSVLADPSLALYNSGVYHPMERNFWVRMAGKTHPVFDLPNCHSGCAPPAALEWRDADLGVLLIGYGTDPTLDLDYWIMQFPWGAGWGEGGYARVLRSADMIADAVVIEPMV